MNTSNGVDEGHLNLPNPSAPSFLCLDKRDGKVLWADGSPGANVLHGQWSSPSYAEIDGVPLFANHVLLRAEGDEAGVRAAVLAPVGGGPEIRIECDTI